MKLDALGPAPTGHERSGGARTLGPSITLTIYADTVTISEAAKALGRDIVEIYGDAQEIRP